MNKTAKNILLALLAAAVLSTAASYAAYLQRRSDRDTNVNAAYRSYGPFGFDTVLSPLGVICECAVTTDAVTGATTITRSVDFRSVLVNTIYLFLPLAAISLWVSRRPGQPLVK
jgi:hypothetical protein